MVLNKTPIYSKTSGSTLWSVIREDNIKLIQIQQYGLGIFGKAIRSLKNENATDFRVITTFEPYYELASSDSKDDINRGKIKL